MRFQSSDRLEPEHIGRRVTVRRRLPDGRASDVIGILESLDERTLKVRRKDGTLIEVPLDEVTAARVVRAR